MKSYLILGIILLLCLIGLIQSCKYRNTPIIDWFEKQRERRQEDRKWFFKIDPQDEEYEQDQSDQKRRRFYFRRKLRTDVLTSI